MGDRGPLLAIAVAAGVVVVLIAIWALFLRDSGTPAASLTGAPTTAAPVVGTLAHLCSDVAPDMPVRVAAVTRTEAAVRADVRALKRKGDTEAAKAGKTLADALASLAKALDTQGDTLTANQALQTALAGLPC